MLFSKQHDNNSEFVTLNEVKGLLPVIEMFRCVDLQSIL